MKLYDELKWRGMIMDQTNNDLEERLNAGGMTFYIGTDPTATSLHIGHLSSFLICKRLKEAGHNPIILLGNATGLIGDPKPDAERPMVSKELIDNNCDAMEKQIKSLFDCEVVRNYDWSKDINFIDYLRDYGKYFPVNYMLNKDIVARRLDAGITYTEFSYMIMQALDFLYLYENKKCIMQVAGQDQWGNITAGVELIRKKLGKEAYAFTMPLVTKKDGTKFGKSAGGALWLDKEMTSPYEIYQFFVNSEDEMVETYLKRFTFLSKEEIEELIKENNKAPEKRIASKRLGFEVVRFIHGEDEAIKAQNKAIDLFENGGMSDDMETIEINKDNTNILDLLVKTNLAPSKSEARRLVIQGGITIDDEKINDPNSLIAKKEFIIKKGKKIFLKIKIK